MFMPIKERIGMPKISSLLKGLGQKKTNMLSMHPNGLILEQEPSVGAARLVPPQFLK